MEENGVAIVGIACRFPGADDIDEFWRVLHNGECHVKKVPDDRWTIQDIDVKDVDDSWKPCSENAGLIADWDTWDNKFFGVSDSEAGWMNPQQCLAIEVTHSALENAGFTKNSLKGTKTGVYIGIMNDDFSSGLISARNEFNNFLVTGIAGSITANKISYFYDLRGPSIVLDTACSSALVAAHLGCQAIKSGECEMAICGGVNSILTPMKFIALSKANMVSPTGLSHTFSDKADGYVRGEGCGILVLKNLAKARKDGDNIWGILGTGCNQDGQTSVPITAPSVEQQLSLLEEVYKSYKMDPGVLQYIEAHGTGTPVGDPIEMKALSTFFGRRLKTGSSIPVGSVKTNIGHLESAAGSAGLIKVLLMMKYGKIVPSLHYKEGEGNPGIDFQNISLFVATKVNEWNVNNEEKRVACVNSFGFGGTNSHAILVQGEEKKKDTANSHEIFPVCVTASSIPALKKTCQHMMQKLLDSNYNVRDLSYTSSIRRDHFRYRLAFAASSLDELKEEIERSLLSIETLQVSNSQDTHLIFLFCGVGTIWAGTCKEMYQSSSHFRAKFDEVDQEIKKLDAKVSLVKQIEKANDDLASDSFIGPMVIFASQVSLYYTWTKLGICPDTIIGQSVGEVAAAHASQCITLQNAVKIIYHRSVLTSQTEKGLMMVIGRCNIKEIEDLCLASDNRLCVAVYSSRNACVVSGNEHAVKKLQTHLNQANPDVLTKILDVSCAYHSSSMDPVKNQLKTKLEDLKGNSPSIRIWSTVTGQEISDNIMGTADYWCRNLREPVLLQEAVSSALIGGKFNVILEIGPKPVIRAHLKNITDKNVKSIASLNQPKERHTFVSAISELFQVGFTIDFKQLFTGNKKTNLTDIPRYKFNRTGKLLKSDALRECLKAKSELSDGHPFVFKNPSTSGFRIDLFPLTTPFVFEHVVQGRNIAPGALYAEVGLVVAKAKLNIPISSIQMSISFLKPLRVGNQSVTLQADLNENESTIYIKRLEEVLCKIKLSKHIKRTIPRVNPADFKRKCTEHIQSNEFYHTLKSFGFQYGSSLTLIKNSWKRNQEYISEIHFCEGEHGTLDSLNLHPAILDSALQTIALSFPTMDGSNKDKLAEDNKRIPVKLKSVVIHKEPEREMFVIGRLSKTSKISSEIDLLIVNKSGELVVEVEGYEVQNLAVGTEMRSLRDTLYQLKWKHLDVEHKSELEHRQPFVITFTNEGYDLFDRILSKSACEIAFVPFQSDKAENFHWQNVLEKLASLYGLKSNLSEILYYPGLHIETGENDPAAVYAMVKTSCLVLTYLIQHLLHQSIDIPLYLITKQCQQSSSLDSKANVIGSELWGMGRCLVRERTFTQIKLIDFEEDEDSTLIRDILYSSKDDVWRNAPEFKLKSGSIYINQIERCPPERPLFRKKQFNIDEFLEVRSPEEDSIDDSFFIPTSDDNSFVPSTYLHIQVSKCYTSNVWIPRASGGTNATDPWGIFKKDGHKIYPAEVEGIVKNTITEHSSSICFGRSRIYPLDTEVNGKEVITCYQTSCKNHIKVPADCTIEKELIPWYSPCSLIEMIMITALLERCTGNSPVAVIHGNEVNLNIEVMKIISERLKRKILMIESIETASGKLYNTKVQIVVLSTNNSHVMQLIKEMHHANIALISLSTFLEKSLERNIRRNFPNCTITIVNAEESLSPINLSATMQKVRGWLKSRRFGSQVVSYVRSLPEQIYGISFGLTYEENNLISAHELTVSTTEDKLFSKHALYIVVGGLTGLGWEIVGKIAKMGGGVITILSRRPPNDQQSRDIRSLMFSYGCDIESIQADISDLSSLRRAFEHMNKKYPHQRIRGIFHGAAVVDDSIILKMTEEKFDRVLRPKILGTWNLHILSRDMNLDYFVLHSSITSAFGNSGQTNYGAGNSFKDAVAVYRRSRQMSGQTINWGPLKLGILETNENVEKHLNSQGYLSLTKEEIMDCFVHVLLTNDIQVVCALFDWKKVVRQSPDMLHLASRVQPILQEYNLVDLFTSAKPTISTIDIDELKKLQPGEQTTKIQEVITFIIADVCAVELSVLNQHTKLQEIGMDSMKAMAFINTVYEYVSCKIPVLSVLEETTTVESISVLIVNQIHEGGSKIGFVPIEELYEFKREIENIRKPLTPLEQIIFESRQESGFQHISFIEAVILISDEVDKKVSDVQKWIKDIVRAHPELSSVYFIDNSIPYRTANASVLSLIEENIKQRHPEIRLSQLIEIIDDTTLSTLNVSMSHQMHDELMEFEDVCISETRLMAMRCGKLDGRTRSLVLRFDTLYFNTRSVITFIKDLFFVLDKGESTPIPSLSEVNDDALLSVLADSVEKQSFWDKRVSLNVKPLYMIGESSHYENKADFIIHRHIFQDSTKILQWAQDRSIPIRDVILSVYQLLMFFISDNDVVSVVTNFDLFSDKEAPFGPTDIALPVITCIDDTNITAERFIKAASEEVESVSQACVPEDELMAKFSSNSHVYDHAVFIDNYDYKLLPKQTKLGETVQLFSVDNRYASTIRIMFDQRDQSLNVDFQCRSNFANDNIATQVLIGLVDLTETVVDNDSLTITQLQKGFREKMDRNTKMDMVRDDVIGSTNSLHKYEVTKETSLGFDHVVTLDLEMIESTASHKEISWYKSKRNRKTLATRDISTIDCTTRNGMRVISLQTARRKYVFKSRNSMQINEITEKLESVVNSTDL